MGAISSILLKAMGQCRSDHGQTLHVQTGGGISLKENRKSSSASLNKRKTGTFPSQEKAPPCVIASF